MLDAVELVAGSEALEIVDHFSLGTYNVYRVGRCKVLIFATSRIN